MKYYIYNAFIILFLFSCKKDVDYKIYYKVEIQPSDYSKPYEAKIDYTNSKSEHIYENISVSEWNASSYGRSDGHAFIRVQGIQNVELINITATINDKKHFKTCNELNCGVEISETLN